MTCVWLNGRIVEAREARVSVLDHGLLYGDGVFEGIRCTAGRVLDFERHLARITTSARALHLKLPAPSLLEQAVFESLAALGRRDAYARLVVTRGEGSLGIDVASCEQVTLFCIAGAIQVYDASSGGLRLLTVSLRRPAFDVLDPRVKTLNYLNNVLAKLEAKRNGGDEALVLNARGTVAEASAANVFAVLDGTLVTPPPADGALSGVTRQRLLRLAQTAGIKVLEASLTRVDLFDADEVFLTGTGAGIVDVASLDGETLGAKRVVSERLRALHTAYVSAHGRAVPGLAAA
jgi:branched-chain amino acid aminotransferase